MDINEIKEKVLAIVAELCETEPANINENTTILVPLDMPPEVFKSCWALTSFKSVVKSSRSSPGSGIMGMVLMSNEAPRLAWIVSSKLLMETPLSVAGAVSVTSAGKSPIANEAVFGTVEVAIIS